jgi:signal transduction histidine kinase
VTERPVESAQDPVGGTVAWFLVDERAERPQEDGIVPLSRRDCLDVARAALALAARQADVSPHQAQAAVAIAGLFESVRVPGLGAWIGRMPAAGGSSLLRALAAALVLPGDDRGPSAPGGGGATPEAGLLRESLRFAAADAALRENFDRAVADARLEAMRELAYGAGHEINNPLANIATRAQALLLEEVDPERRRRLSTIVDQAFRARDMIGGLMVFARPPKPRRETSDVGGIVTAAIEAVRVQAAGRGVRLEYSPLPAPAAVFVDRVQAEEAVRVVIVNALEAAAAGGRVVVRVSRCLDDGPGVCEVSVEDTGRGMPLEQVKRAFDPFYSGREAGRGAGLGLPKAWRLVESSGGTVLIDSRPGHGTRVLIRLPMESVGSGSRPAGLHGAESRDAAAVPRDTAT